MELTNYIILAIGALLLVSVYASLLSARVGMPLLLVFLGLGMLMGEQGPGGIKYDDVQSAHLIGSLALAVILFDGGMRTEVTTFRVGLRPAMLLSTLGVLVSSLVTGWAAMWVFDLHWMEGMLIGAIVGSTDAAAVFSLLRNQGIELKQRVGATLEIESGSNDPMAIFLTIVLVEALATGRSVLEWHWLLEFVQQMGLGGLAGVGGGWLLVRMVNRIRLTPGLYPLLVLAAALALFGAVSSIGGSGFLAVYLAGLVVGNKPLQAGHNILRFHDGMAWLAQIGLFLVLGLLVQPSALLDHAGQALFVAAILMFVARPLAVALCLKPFHLPWREQVFIAWVGLRGAVPIVLALFPLLAGLEHAREFFNTAFFVVLVSLTVQGWSVAPLARKLGLNVPQESVGLHRVGLDIPGQPDFELAVYEVAARTPIAGKPLTALTLPPGCRLAGLVHDGEPQDLRQVENFRVGDFVYVLAFRQALPQLERMFIPTSAQAETAKRQFFGEFVLKGDARLEDMALVYGISVPPEYSGKSLAQLFGEHFHGRQVPGDRLPLGSIELVIKEMQGEQVVSVGVKLPH
ncbi:potassium/proton antiporter [Sulfurivermis fontis]|uniref:potassium/proton antiporter n=1 Tax=Sulfurivermis fontis TaxID=1972068 RepID=UPI000FDA4929|nr:potassium/proton antiporter [Sulfurivermis fontis]